MFRYERVVPIPPEGGFPLAERRRCGYRLFRRAKAAIGRAGGETRGENVVGKIGTSEGEIRYKIGEGSVFLQSDFPSAVTTVITGPDHISYARVPRIGEQEEVSLSNHPDVVPLVMSVIQEVEDLSQR